MKLIKNKEIVIRYIGKKVITNTFKSLKLIWQAVRSCFGSGNWQNEKQWNNEEAFKNN